MEITKNKRFSLYFWEEAKAVKIKYHAKLDHSVNKNVFIMGLLKYKGKFSVSVSLTKKCKL